MPFSPTITRDSTALPDVKFTIRRMGLSRRTDLDFDTLKLRQRLRELEADHPPRTDKEKELSEQLAIATKKALAVSAEESEAVMKADVEPLAAELAACVPAEVKKARAVLNEEYVQVENRISAAWIRAGFVSIEGGDVDGMTAEQLLDYGPPALAAEIYEALTKDARLGGTERGNSSSPITSGEAAGGEKKTSTAASVEALPVVTT